MQNLGLSDPLGASRVLRELESKARNIGLKTRTSHDMVKFAAEKLLCTKTGLSPMFDPQINDFSHNKAFWVKASNEKNEIVCFQSFRLDYVDTSLADWALTWMLGLYHKRSEAIVPLYTRPPENARSYEVRGNVVYHGELWIHPSYRHMRLLEIYPSLGMFLALLKWQPDYIWALVSERAAKRSQTVRMGYPIAERGIFRWEWEPKGADQTEWLALASRSDLEHLIDEMASNISEPPGSVSENAAADPAKSDA